MPRPRKYASAKPRCFHVDSAVYERLKRVLAERFGKSISEEVNELLRRRLEELDGVLPSEDFQEKVRYERLKRADENVVGESYIKVWIALDRLDILDTAKEKASFVERGQPTLDMEQNKLFSESLAVKLPKLRSWIYTHRDSEGLVDVQELAVQIRELGLDVLQTVQILKNDGVIFDSPKLGRFGVK